MCVTVLDGVQCRNYALRNHNVCRKCLDRFEDVQAPATYDNFAKAAPKPDITKYQYKCLMCGTAGREFPMSAERAKLVALAGTRERCPGCGGYMLLEPGDSNGTGKDYSAYTAHLKLNGEKDSK
jgi:DNA-directed RNA polymerase subunit RPC12/RpoP